MNYSNLCDILLLCTKRKPLRVTVLSYICLLCCHTVLDVWALEMFSSFDLFFKVNCDLNIVSLNTLFPHHAL